MLDTWIDSPFETWNSDIYQTLQWHDVVIRIPTDFMKTLLIQSLEPKLFLCARQMCVSVCKEHVGRGITGVYNLQLFFENVAFNYNVQRRFIRIIIIWNNGINLIPKHNVTSRQCVVWQYHYICYVMYIPLRYLIHFSDILA